MKKILCFISVFFLFITFSFSVSADTQNVLVYELDSEFFLNKYPSNGVISDDGYYTVTVSKSGIRGNGSEYNLNPDNTYFFTIDGDFKIFDWNTASILKPNVNFTGVKIPAISLSLKGSKIKSFKVYEVVQAPFGYGGLSGNSSDIHYGVEVITDVFSKLWNVFTDYWWVMVGLCLPIAFYLLCILSDVFLKVPKGRFKPKIFSTGYYSGKKAFSSNSLTFDINKRKNRKVFGSSNNVHDVFIVDGCTYYNRNKNKYTRRKSVNVDVEVDK